MENIGEQNEPIGEHVDEPLPSVIEKEKKPRKNRETHSPAQLETLKRGREKLAEKRQKQREAKKEAPVNDMLQNFEKRCNEMLENFEKKKYTKRKLLLIMHRKTSILIYHLRFKNSLFKLFKAGRPQVSLKKVSLRGVPACILYVMLSGTWVSS